MRIVICKSRRAGLSTGVEAEIFDDTITYPNTQSLIVSNQSNPSENVLGMCTRFWEEMPAYFDVGGMRIKVRPDLPPEFNNNPPKNKLFLADPINSKIFIATAKSVDAYLSFDFQNIHATEASRFDDGRELFRALYPTLSTDPHSALYVESTPNGQEGKGQWFYELCMDADARKDTQYGELALVFIPWHEMIYSFAVPFESDAKRIAFTKSYTASERDVVKQLPNVSPEQMRWRRMMLAGPTFQNDEEMFDQEYPTDLATAFLTTGESVFPRKQIKELMQNVREPIWTGDVYWGDSDVTNEREATHDVVRRPHFYTPGEAKACGFASHVNERTFQNLRVWRWPKKGERIIVSADVGQGSPSTRDGDWSTAGVFVLNELERDELIMTWKGHLNPILYGELLSALCWAVRYKVGEAVVAPELVPEWTGPGTGLNTYIDQKNLYPVLYRYQQPGVHGLPKSKHVGWESNGKTVPFAMSSMRRMVEQGFIDIPDRDVVLQMANFKQLDGYGDKGSFGGAGGRHDDYVSMLAIGCGVLRIRSATVPGDAEVEYYDPMDDDGGDLPDWDPFAGRDPVLALEPEEVDEESYEEHLFWSPPEE